MTPFLKQVARHYCAEFGGDGGLVFVVPSQRAVVFFRKYAAEAVKENGLAPVFAPEILSIDDFFASLSPLKRVDQILLLLKLYDCYKEVCSEKGIVAEELDKFVFWGNIILSDFGDVDKYLVDAEDLFRNVSQYKDLQDDYEGLSPTQKAALEAFLGQFEKDGKYKRLFAATWNILYPLYERFNALLKEEGTAYEGSLYRSLAEDVERRGVETVLSGAYPKCGKVVFCGLNALNECEKKILRRLQSAGKAEFCWDYVSEWIQDPQNKSSFFLKENIAAFPQAFELERCDAKPEIEVVRVPSAVGQTKLLTQLLSDKSIPADENTAIVLPDESLLLPMLNSVPERVEGINVTMGFAMSSSSFFSLMDDISQLQLHVRRKDGAVSFYHKNVWSIVSNNIFEALCDSGTKEKVVTMKSARRYYVPAADINGTPLLDLVFTSPVPDPEHSTDNAPVADYLIGILNYIGGRIAGDEELKRKFSLELDFAMEYVKTVNLLSSRQVSVTVPTWLRMLRSLLQSKSIPFKGEPLHGLQIMGPLEIRALDFDKLFILSSNEAVFPHKSTSPSFIPPLLRRGFSLPTYEYQDAVWAYYFYRMIQRPSKVWMVLDSRTEGLKSGEESRYIKQLEYHFGVPLVRKSSDSVPRPAADEPSIAKTEDHIRLMREKPLSASAIKQYLACPVRFYYSFVEGLDEEEEVAESLDAGMTGNVFHKTMQHIYTNLGGKVTADALAAVMEDKAYIRRTVEDFIRKELNDDSIHGRDLVVSELIRKYVSATLECDLNFIRQSGREYFEIYGLEEKVEGRMGNFRFKGYIDRLDSFCDGQIRIVDYKTGEVKKEDVNIGDGNAEDTAAKIFGTSNQKRPEIALQMFVYDYLLAQKGLDRGRIVVNSVYSTRSILKEPPLNVYKNQKFYDTMCSQLGRMLEELENPDLDFRRTDDARTCEHCKFRTICGR